MKNAKNVFQILCFMLVALTFTNCQHDTITETQQEAIVQKKFPFTASLISQQEVEVNTKLSNQMRRLATLQFSNIAENGYHELYNFTVNTEVVNFAESTASDSHSYTFSVDRENNTESILENLVFSYDVLTDDYKASLVTYHFTALQQQEFIISKHVSTPYEITYEPIVVNLSDILGETALPCNTNYTVYHITPDTGETFVQSSSIGNINNECRHQDEGGDTQCTTYTIITTDCPVGGSSSASSSGPSNSASGGNNTTNSGNTSLPNTDDIVTLPNIDLGNWLIEALGIGNLNASSDEQIIWNWIEDNYSPLTLAGHDNLFFDVYNFYTGNVSVVNIDDIVKEVILNLDADPNLTFEEALLEADVVIVESGQPKVDPSVELSCFDLTQGAKLTVYVQQPMENSSALVGPNQVGHAFIGIEQGGIVRQIGYYPDKEVGPTGVGADFDAAIKTNYDYLYHVSISQNISSEQLTNIVNYSIGFPPTYNTNNYACADFAINIGNLGGMNLPSTTVSSFLFTGRSPGVLGQEIRAMSSTSSTTISTVKTNSPTRQGGCLGSN